MYPSVHIFNLRFVSGIFHTKLKLDRTVPVFKFSDDNYRHIYLISTFSKILEKIVSINLANHIQLN
jgi:hypothetical protein